MAGGQHESIGVRMLGTAVVEAKPAGGRSRQMSRDIEWCVGHRTTKVSGLRVIAEQRQRHARHEADIGQLFPLFGRFRTCN